MEKANIKRNEIRDYYDSHRLKDCCEYFQMTSNEFKNLLNDFNIHLRNNRENQCLSFYVNNNLVNFYTFIETVNRDEFECYYRTHTKEEIFNKYRITEAVYDRLLKHWNIKLKTQKEITEIEKRRFSDKYGENCTCTFNVKELNEKCEKSKEIKYGDKNYVQTRDFKHKATNHYIYDNEVFDSSWELALWIYAIDHHISIKHVSNFYIEYRDYNNKIRRYYPDFEYENNLIDVKGPQFIKDGDLIDLYGGNRASYKQQCMIDNHVKLFTYDDILPMLEYCNNKYNSKKWHKQFRRK